MELPLISGQQFQFPLRVLQLESVMLWMLSTLLCIMGKFFRLLVLQTMLGETNLEVRVKQENIVDMHFFGRIDTDHVAVSDQKPLWHMSAFEICRSQSLSEVDAHTRSNHQETLLSVVATFCRQSHAQGRDLEKFAKTIAVGTEKHELDHLLQIDLQLLALSFRVSISFATSRCRRHGPFARYCRTAC